MSLSTTQLRKAWKLYECAESKMSKFDFLGDIILVAPPTVDAFSALASVLTTHNYHVRSKDTDSYNCRQITGGTEKSLHSYGIALDINWQTNPYTDHQGSRPPRFSERATQDDRALDVKVAKADTDMTRAMVNDVLAIVTNKGERVFEWGGDWKTVKDAMHFEIDVSPEDLAVGIDWGSVKGERQLPSAPKNLVEAVQKGSGAAQLSELTLPAGAYTDAFLKCHILIEKWEGGFVNDPQDPGGATNLGITLAVLSQWRGHPVTVQDVRNLDREEARRIFYAKYWKPLRCDDLPLPLALMTYNCGVNSGIGRAGKFVQRTLNRQGASLSEDGNIGQLSVDAANQVDVAQSVSDFGDIYEAFYRSLSTFGHFGKGWMNRLTEVLKIATSWLPSSTQSQNQPTDASTTSTEIQKNSNTGVNAMASSTSAPQLTAIDKALGGSVMVGKKTLTAAGVYAATMLAHKNGLLDISQSNYDTVVQLIGLYGGLGVISKMERSNTN